MTFDYSLLDIISTNNLKDVAAMFQHPATRPLHTGGVTMSEILTQKKCTKCGEWKDRNKSNFATDNRYKDGFYPSCRACKSLIDKAYYEKMGEGYIAKRRDYYNDHREHQKELKRLNYHLNKEKHSKRNRAYMLKQNFGI